MIFNLLSKGKKKSYDFRNFSISIILDNGWAEYVEQDEKSYSLPLSFFKEDDGVGALQISVISSEEKDPVDDIDKILKENRQSELVTKKYKLRDWSVYEAEETKNGRVFRYFYLLKSNFVVYATYNFELNHFNESESNEAEKIVRSIDLAIKN